jgi:RNA polymerase sigma-70 factor (ECF subfamily)
MDDGDLAGLIERVKSGDEAAIRDLIQRFERDVRTIVRVRLPQSLRSQFDSMDFVQAVWQSVLTKDAQDLGRFTNARHFRGFLEGVARNKVYEEHRRRTRTRKYSVQREEPLYVRRGDREMPREVAASDPSPSQDAQARERFAQLVAGRSPEEAEVVDLRRRGLTYDEIAERTGLNERSVRRIIEAIRQRMEARKWR